MVMCFPNASIWGRPDNKVLQDLLNPTILRRTFAADFATGSLQCDVDFGLEIMVSELVGQSSVRAITQG